MKKVFLFVTAVFCCARIASASERVEGTFTTVRECDAYQSFREGTNPSMIKVKLGATYEAAEINKAGDWNWIRVEIEGATPNLRWVSKECGTADIKTDIKIDGSGKNTSDEL